MKTTQTRERALEELVDVITRTMADNYSSTRSGWFPISADFISALQEARTVLKKLRNDNEKGV